MSLINPRKTQKQTRELLTVDDIQQPDWVLATERPLIVGERVLCAEGFAELSKVLGKTGDGSRLLELILPDRPKHPFFAAASNVRIAPQA
jgi:hypothetical protein